MIASNFMPPPGMIAWYDADTINAASGVPFSTWVDKSKNGFHAYQQTEAAQPTLIANAIGRKSAVRFGGSQCLGLPVIRTTTGGVHAFVVSQRLVAGGETWQRLFSSWDGISGDDFLGAGWAIYPATNSNGTALVYGPDVRTLNMAVGKKIEYNMIGKNSSSGQYFQGEISEIIIYPTSLPQWKVYDVYRYLNAKFRLAASQMYRREIIDLQLLLARQSQPAFLSAWAQGINAQIGVN